MNHCLAQIGIEHARRLDLPIPVASGAGRVLVGPGDRRVDADVPHDLAGGVGE